MLHISSTCFESDYLCAEGNHGELDKICFEELKEILLPKEEDLLTIDIVILAIPCSRLLAEWFINF